jgi:hypothetical protein
MRTTNDPKPSCVKRIIHNPDFSGFVTIVDFQDKTYDIPGGMLLSGNVMTIDRSVIPSEVLFRAIVLVNREFILAQLDPRPENLEDPDR